MEKEMVLKKLMALDFASLDLQLFLDTHPGDCEVLRLYNKYIEEAERVRVKYEQQYGPLCSYRSAGGDKWSWINDPWPWECWHSYEKRMEAI